MKNEPNEIRPLTDDHVWSDSKNGWVPKKKPAEERALNFLDGMNEDRLTLLFKFAIVVAMILVVLKAVL